MSQKVQGMHVWKKTTKPINTKICLYTEKKARIGRRQLEWAEFISIIL